jgi:hypothetical protein
VKGYLLTSVSGFFCDCSPPKTDKQVLVSGVVTKVSKYFVVGYRIDVDGDKSPTTSSPAPAVLYQ